MQTKLLTRVQASAHLAEMGIPVAPATLATWAVYGRGPVFGKIGRKPLYPVDTLERWASDQLAFAANSTAAHDAARASARR